MVGMDAPRRGPFGWLPPALRRLEHKLGAQRDERSLWVWVVPAGTVVVTFLILAFIGMQGNVDLFLTIPMALVLSVFLGSLSAFYLTAASSDERDIAEDDDGRGRPHPVTPTEPPPPAARPLAPAPGEPPPRDVAGEPEREPVGATGPGDR